MSKLKLALVHSNTGRDFEKIQKSNRKQELTPKQKAFRFRSCTSKQRFRNEKETRNFIAHLKRKRNKMNKELEPLRPYTCNFCNGYHTTSSIPNEKAAA
jgi:hypothetical protein